MVGSVVFNSETPEEDPAHVAAMAAKGEALQNGEPIPKAESPSEPNADRPAWLPEKFKTAEEFANSYKELEKKLGAGKPAEEEATAESESQKDDTSTDPLKVSTEKAEEALDEKGFDMAALRQEYSENGSLSEETLGKLEKAGFSQQDVNDYIEGQKARVEGIRASSFSIVGGEENYQAMAAWAKANLSPEEIATFNEGVGSEKTRELAIRGLYSKYSSENGNEPGRRLGNNNSAVSTDVYESREQMKRDMNSVEYKKDPAFRKKVEEKLARSTIV